MSSKLAAHYNCYAVVTVDPLNMASGLTISSSSRKSTYQRKFNPEMYSKHDWLCGCDVKNMFCFSCLLNGGDAWTTAGETDLGHLPEKTEKYKSSEKHKKCDLFGHAW
jgi:hypothetical protein